MKVIVFLCAIAAVFGDIVPDVQTCEGPPEIGPIKCLAYIPMFYYDTISGTCKPFIYGGCHGTGNRYATEESCIENCAVLGVQKAGRPVDVCTLPKKEGMCLAYFPRYYFDQEIGKCTEFIYGGCQGNGNNFETLEECQSYCPDTQAAFERLDCEKAPETGLCKAYIPRYYYEQETGTCKTFIYGGCGGNRNNFKTEEECQNKCGALSSPSACEQSKVVGPCRGYFPRYYYNKASGKCEEFIYGGCGGNDNNFNNKEDCEGICIPSRASGKCSDEPETGVCRGHFLRFYYDHENNICKEFYYGGCGGNENNYETMEDCFNSCFAQV